MIASLLAWLIRLFAGLRVLRISSSEKEKLIFIARHQSHFDTLAIWASLPPRHRKKIRPVAALDYWGKTKVHHWFSTKVLNAILISRKGRSAEHRHPLDPLREALEAGSHLLVFPEGTRRSDSEVGPLKPGIHHLMKMVPEARCLPVRLDNLSRVLPKGEALPLPLIARIEAGEAIALSPDESKEEFLQRCQAAISLPQE